MKNFSTMKERFGGKKVRMVGPTVAAGWCFNPSPGLPSPVVLDACCTSTGLTGRGLKLKKTKQDGEASNCIAGYALKAHSVVARTESCFEDLKSKYFQWEKRDL